MSEGYSQAPTAGLPGRVSIQAPGDPHDAQSSAHAHHPKLQHHFDDMAQQAEASTLGMWVFLVTEIMFFGGLFTAYLVYRALNPMAFQEASAHLSWKLGAFNTAVLIFSSLTMALAVRSAQTSEPRTRQVMWLVATIVLGSVFLGVKVIEYSEKFAHNNVPGPNFVWKPSAFSASTAAPYSMQPFSARQAGTLALNAWSTPARSPGRSVASVRRGATHHLGGGFDNGAPVRHRAPRSRVGSATPGTPRPRASRTWSRRGRRGGLPRS